MMTNNYSVLKRIWKVYEKIDSWVINIICFFFLLIHRQGLGFAVLNYEQNWIKPFLFFSATKTS